MKSKTIEIVINSCYGGFGISTSCAKLLLKLGVKTDKPGADSYEERFVDFMRRFKGADWTPELGMVMRWAEENRAHPYLVRAVKKLGKDADNKFSELKVITIPSDVKWTIGEYDGTETVEEVHRSWR